MNKMFIVAKYPQTLRNPASSNKPGIGKNQAAWQHNEEVKCVKNLKTRDATEASVILDVANEKVIKNRFNDNRDFQELYRYYLEHYADYINRWVTMQTDGR